jgi:GDPmannose 4,6-dehydratase
MKALITGVSGQDGAYLAKLLCDSGVKVWGGVRKHSGESLWRLNLLGILNDINLFSHENGNGGAISDLLHGEDFDFLFHFAGNSYTIDSIENPRGTFETNTLGLLDILETIKRSNYRPNIFVAGSSEIFGDVVLPRAVPCDEETPVSPRNPYGISHSTNMQIVDFYRKEYGFKINLGIFFNHESAIRSQQFLTRKLSIALSSIKEDNKPIPLGNLDSVRDFGYAPNFMRAAMALSKTHFSSNFIFSGGAIHSIREVVAIFATLAGFTPKFVGEGLNESCIDVKSGNTLFYVSEKYFRKRDTRGNFGNSKKLEDIIGFHLHKPLIEIAQEMIDFDSANHSLGRMY